MGIVSVNVLLLLAFAVVAPAAHPEKVVAILDGHKITLEVVDTDEARQKGLMFRRKLDPNHGMLFVFEENRNLSFWMKNTFIPLAIGYFNQNLKLIDIHEMEPVASEMETPTKYYVSKVPARLALEMESGWFAKNNVIVDQATLKFPQVPKSRLLRKLLKN